MDLSSCAHSQVRVSPYEMKGIPNMSQKILMSNCHTLQEKKLRLRESEITQQDLEMQSLGGRMLGQDKTCSYAALLWS